MFEVPHHDRCHILGNLCIDECSAHAIDPVVARLEIDVERGMSHAKPRMPLALAVGLRPAEVLDEKLGLISNRLLEVGREHGPQARMNIDSCVERACNAPEGIRTKSFIERLKRIHWAVSYGWMMPMLAVPSTLVSFPSFVALAAILSLTAPGAADSPRPSTPTQAADESVAPIPANLLAPIPAVGGVPPITDPPGDPEAMLFGARAEQRSYERVLRDLCHRSFRTQRADVRADGLAQLRQFTDPASFEPMIMVLAREAPEIRRAMLDHFAESGDYGQAALAYVAISDPDRTFRHEATTRIRRPACDAVMRVVDAALRQKRHDFVNNAGALAGNLNILAAIPPMIFGQVADDPVRGTGDLAWIAIGTTKTYVANVVPIVGDNSGAFAPVIGSVIEGVVLRIQDAVAYSYRTELHESLVNMTSADFGENTESMGYDMRAWWHWFNTRYVPFKQKQEEERQRTAAIEEARSRQAAAPPPPPAPPEPPAPRDPLEPRDAAAPRKPAELNDVAAPRETADPRGRSASTSR